MPQIATPIDNLIEGLKSLEPYSPTAAYKYWEALQLIHADLDTLFKTVSALNLSSSSSTPVIISPIVNYQSFTASGNWVMPSGWLSAYVKVRCQGAGAGAGSGCKDIAGNVGWGGVGGGAGELKLYEGIISANQAIIIGAKGTGGASQTSNGSKGNNGTNGGNSSFGSLITALGGNLGVGGENNAA